MFLGVTSSLTGRQWLGPTSDMQRHAEMLVQHLDLNPALANVLARRGVEADGVEAFLAPTLRELMPDPHTMRDCDTATDRMMTAILEKERIAIFADYDVDGACSATLLVDTFRFFGIEPTLYVPDRIDEGYGPNAPAMEKLSRAHDLIICVDCGTLSHDALGAAFSDVIVLDHHLGGETLPKSVAVVNPNRQDESGALNHLCAAGVVFLVLVDLRRKLQAKGQKFPNLLQMLDIVGLATVADVAPLIGLNRAFVRQGLTVMAGRNRIGLTALADAAKLDRAPDAYHFGYVLGPRINAGGRIGQADLGARLLSSTDPVEAAALADRLDELNTDRRTVEADVRLSALAQIETRPQDGALVWAAGDGWHAGVVGIVASRLKEQTNRPAIVIGFDGDDGKGSGRSVSGIDLGAEIQRLAREGLIEKGGGHKMAAGLSLTRAQLEPAMARLNERLVMQGADRLGPADLKVDAAIMPGAITQDLIETLERAGPFGASAPSPRFALPDCTIGFAKRVGENHLKLSVTDGFGTKLDVICFGAFDTQIGPSLLDAKGQKFHLAGRLELNFWQGKSRPQLRLEDAAYA